MFFPAGWHKDLGLPGKSVLNLEQLAIAEWHWTDSVDEFSQHYTQVTTVNVTTV